MQVLMSLGDVITEVADAPPTPSTPALDLIKYVAFNVPLTSTSYPPDPVMSVYTIHDCAPDRRAPIHIKVYWHILPMVLPPARMSCSSCRSQIEASSSVGPPSALSPTRAQKPGPPGGSGGQGNKMSQEAKKEYIAMELLHVWVQMQAGSSV
jgi:hypothetical protein